MLQKLHARLRYAAGPGIGPRLLRAASGSGALQMAGMALSFLVGVQLARGLGVEGYGQYGIAMAVITLAAVPAQLGLPKLLTREVAAATTRSDPARLWFVFRWASRTSVLLSIATAAAVAVGVLLVFGSPALPAAAAILVGLPAIPLTAAVRIRGAVLQGLHHLVLGQAPDVLLRPLLLAFLLFFLFRLEPGAGAAEAMLLNGITAFAAFLLAAWLLRSRLPRRPAEIPAEKPAGLLTSAFAFGLTQGMFLLQGQLSLLILAALASDAQVGLFRIGLSIIVIIALPVTLLSIVTAPTLSSLHSSGDRVLIQKLATSAVRAQVAGTILVSLPVLVAGEQIVGFIFGEEYRAAAAGLKILCIGQILAAAFGIAAGLLNMTGHERKLTRSVGAGAAINAALTLLLVPGLGYLGAALAYAVSMIAWNLLAWASARRALSIDSRLR